MNTALIAEGAWGKVWWATDSRGRRPAKDFYSALDVSDQAKMMALFNRMANFGGIQNREHFKSLGKEGGKLFAFKKHQLRFIGDFRPGRNFIVAVGIRKKADDLRRQDIETAIRILKEHDEQVAPTIRGDEK